MSSVIALGTTPTMPAGRAARTFEQSRGLHDRTYTDVYVMRPDGSAVLRLTSNRACTPAWSPDGSHIVASAPGLFVMDADGSNVMPVPTPGVGETTLPDWTE
jgi:hypothetical protein